MSDHLPEDVIVRIMERLPIKSLFRFTSVSKTWRSIILSDPEFAKSQFQLASLHQTFRHRVLISSPNQPDFDSADLAAPLSSFQDKSSVREIRCPFFLPGTPVNLLGSCNGLVLASFRFDQTNMFIWNPSTGFFRKLPHPVAVPSERQRVKLYGFGYLSATDDYKVVAKLSMHEGKVDPSEIFSMRADSWKRIQDPPFSTVFDSGHPALLNEALHWISMGDIVAFDLAKEEFRIMPCPVVDDGRPQSHLVASFRGCLCVFVQGDTDVGSLDLWIMREYGMAESWTKLFNLKVSDFAKEINYLDRIILVNETGTFLYKMTFTRERRTDHKLIRSDHEEEKLETYVLNRNMRSMIEYEESLLWLR